MKPGVKPLNYAEMDAAQKALRRDDFPSGWTNTTEKAREVVTEVFAAFFRARYGEAVGTVAVNAKTGQCAVRYYDQEMNCLRWLVYESPERADGLYGERMDSLPAKGEGWKINERDWKELVYK